MNKRGVKSLIKGIIVIVLTIIVITNLVASVPHTTQEQRYPIVYL